MSASLEAGLTLRPLAETARDTLRWLDAANGPITGLNADQESGLLAAWHSGRR